MVGRRRLVAEYVTGNGVLLQARQSDVHRPSSVLRKCPEDELYRQGEGDVPDATLVCLRG
jgi:hypothetical protein